MTYVHTIKNFDSLLDNVLLGYECPEPMAWDAVALGEREQVNEIGAPVPAIPRCEQVMRWPRYNKVTICFVEDQREFVFNCKIPEISDERWRICDTRLLLCLV